MTDAPPAWAITPRERLAEANKGREIICASDDHIFIRQDVAEAAIEADRLAIAAALSRPRPITDAEVGVATERLRQKFGWPLPQDLVDGVRPALEAVLAYRREHPNG